MPVAAGRDEKAKATRFSDIVYEKIVAMIADGRFPVNDRLPSENRLAGLFGASRPVVREALEKLRKDNLIVSRKGSGSYVRQRPDRLVLEQVPVGSLARVQQFFEFRAGVEAAAAGLAARNATAQGRRQILDALTRLGAAVQRGDLGDVEDIALHDSIAAASGNPFHIQLRELFRPHYSVGQSVTRSLSLRRSPQQLQVVQDEHAAIVAAIIARDALRAAEAMRIHIENARDRMFRGIDD